jgi:phosphoenolpyruvate carboxykinase (GTP)
MTTHSEDRAATAAEWNGRNPEVPLSKNTHLLKWVEKMARLTQPAAIH